ncbi:hypothetical protein SAMN04490355_10721, partial [Pelosinus propionicus DSM 13327]
MSYANFYSFNITDNKQNKGGRSASEEIDYLENEKEEKIEKTINGYSPKGAENEAEYLVGNNLRREDLALFKTDNMPRWAEEEADNNGTSPHLEFFKASETYEATKNVTYREIKLALPQELIGIHSQNVTDVKKLEILVDDFMVKSGLDKMTYAYAIHLKDAQFSPNDKNIHVHIMWSDRIPDGIDRPKEQYFGWGEDKRYRPKSPKLGPCKKDDTYSNSNRTQHLKKIRKIAEQTINEHYKNNDIDLWVCCGKKADIEQMSLERGDYIAAEIARDVPAQTHVGEKAASKLDHPRTRKAIELKEQAQAIRDKYKLQEIEQQELGTPFPKYETLPNNIDELQQLLTTINSRMFEIKELFFKDNPDSSPIIDNKIINDINSLQAEIILTKNRISKDTHLSAIRKFCNDNNFKDEFIKYSSQKKDLEFKKNLVIKIEQQITNKFFKNQNEANNILLNELSKNANSNFKPEEHCSQAQKLLLQNAKIKITELEKSTSTFEQRHILPNTDKITELENKVIARNEGNHNKIAKLSVKIDELQNMTPELKLALDKQKEITDLLIQSQKNEPKFYQNHEAWEAKHKELLQQQKEIISIIQDLKQSPIKTEPKPEPTQDPIQPTIPAYKPKYDVDQLFKDYDTQNRYIQKYFNEIKELNSSLNTNQNMQQKIVKDHSELTILAISNLSKVSTETIKSQQKNIEKSKQQYAE